MNHIWNIILPRLKNSKTLTTLFLEAQLYLGFSEQHYETPKKKTCEVENALFTIKQDVESIFSLTNKFTLTFNNKKFNA